MHCHLGAVHDEIGLVVAFGMPVYDTPERREWPTSRLGVPKEEIKPCLALMGGQREEHRAGIAGVIAYKLAEIDVIEGRVLSYIGWYVGG